MSRLSTRMAIVSVVLGFIAFPTLLNAAATTGSLKVTSFPAGANVMVDGADTGKVTPMSVRLTVGTHTVVVSIPNSGWNASTNTVGIVAGTNDLSVTLLPALTVGPQGPTGAVGPMGPAGPQGPAGPAGSIASSDSLAGIPCTLAGQTGIVSISMASDGTMTLRCVVPPTPPSPPPGPICLLPLTPSASTTAAAIAVALPTGDFAIPPQCGTNTSVACPGGSPSQSVITIAPGAPAVTATADPDRFTFSLLAGAHTPQPVSVTLSVAPLGAVTCAVSFDSGASLLTIDGLAVFGKQAPGDTTIDRVDLTNISITGITASMFSVTGDAACSALGSALAGFFPNVVESAIAGTVSVGVCQLCESTSLAVCPGR